MIAGQRVRDGIEGHHEGHPGVARGRVERAVGPHDRGARALGRVGPHRVEQGELTAARAAEEADARRVHVQPPRVRAGVADAGGDVGARDRKSVVRGLAEIERDDDQPRRGERPAQ